MKARSTRGLPHRAVLVLPALALVVGLGVPALRAEICEFRSDSHIRSNSMRDTIGHKSGRHRSRAVVDYRCICQSDCRSTCTPSWQETTCEDSGTISGNFVHKRRTRQKLKTGDRPNALHKGADCGAGWGCFIEQCRPGQCNPFQFTLKLTPLDVGVSIEFTADRAPLADMQLDFPFQCDECMTKEEVAGELDEEPDQPSPGSGDGGSGGGPGEWSSCQFNCWVTSFDGHRYTEVCELVGCF